MKNTDYLREACDLLSGKAVFISDQYEIAGHVSLEDNLDKILYQRLLYLKNEFIRASNKVGQKFVFGEENGQQVNYSLVLNGNTYVTFERTSKISSQIRKDMRKHLLDPEKRAKNGYQYYKLITFLLYDIFYINKIPLPTYLGKPVLLLDDLFNALCGRNPNVLHGKEKWNEIYYTKEKLCYYLFGLYPESSKYEIISVLSEWNCISDVRAKEYTINEVYEIACKIVDACSLQPMYGYLLKENPIKHMLEVREILKHMLQHKNMGSIYLEPPVKSISSWIKKLTSHMLRDTCYTSRDFIQFIGILAKRAKDTFGHSIGVNDLEAIRRSEFSDVAKEDWDYYVSMFQVFANSFLAVSVEPDVYKFRIKPFRLILAGIADAEKINELHLNPIPFVENYFPMKKIRECVRLSDEFDVKHDEYCFYGLSLLYHLSAERRNCCIEEMCKKAEDFSVSFRSTQICYLYLLTVILASELPLSYRQREKIMLKCYGKTMYRFQASFFRYLLQTSSYFKECVEKSVRNACTVEMKIIGENSVQKVALGQPYYFFAYGIIHEASNIISFAEMEKGKLSLSECFLRNAASIQCKTWYPAHEVSNKEKKDLMQVISSGFEMGLKHITNGQNICSLSTDLMRYVYGIQLLGYAFANLMNYHKGSLSKIFVTEEQTMEKGKEIAFNALVYSDYYMRVANVAYPDNIKGGCILCGTYRATSATDIRPIAGISLCTNDNNEGKMYPAYYQWLKKEWENERTKRYAYLMARVLNSTGSQNELKDLIEEILHNANNIDFMDYDKPQCYLSKL